jgi:hypothetical protein
MERRQRRCEKVDAELGAGHAVRVSDESFYYSIFGII